MPFPARRKLEPELMDQPGLDPARHRQALAGLARINFLSLTAGSFFRPLLALQRRLGRERLRILDVASGGGDVTRRLWHRAFRAGLDWRIAGCDISPTAVEQAREASAREKCEAHFFAHDVLAGPPPGDFDAVICSLFFHHLEDEQIVRLLSALAGPRQNRPSALFVSDLDRGPFHLGLAWVVSRLLSRSPIVHTDAVLSVRAALTPGEITGLAARAGLTVSVRRTWPCRWLLSWSAP